MSGYGREYCEQCKVAARFKGIVESCNDCEGRAPELIYDNEAYLDCFLQCQTQLRVGPSGAIFGLDWNVVIRVAEIHGIEVDERFILCLKAFEGTMIEEVNKRSKKNG